ncbi:hypothetical protein [Gynuella sp.]|uniref:hypothetical protein n=1 Tax=Gynuella sp. TaxID=2969146 RepID=UPI003D0FBE60
MKIENVGLNSHRTAGLNSSSGAAAEGRQFKAGRETLPHFKKSLFIAAFFMPDENRSAGLNSHRTVGLNSLSGAAAEGLRLKSG